MIKLESIDEGLDYIENIDKDIILYLEKDEYGKIIDSLKTRLTVISQMNKIRDDVGINNDTKKRLDKIFSEGNKIQQRVQEKKDKVNERLKKSRKIKTQNKKIQY